MESIETGSGRATFLAMLGLALAGCGAGSNPAPISPSPSYSIGGTVTGLKPGAQLALSNNGGSPLSISVNGDYAFPVAVALHGSYSVAVATQPSGQVCSVVNHSGAGVAANVTNVGVGCSNRTYTIGGSVAGLAAGQQLGLRDNGADALSISDNGKFTFATPVAFDGSYSVTVGTQPEGVICTVSNLSGAGVVANIGNILVNCSSIRYSVSGSVTGLASGLQVTLQDNAADALIVSGNGTFSFATPVAYGGSYAVTIATEPVGQICTASDASASAVHANVAGVAITCSNLSYSIGGSVSGLDPGAQVTLNNNGADALTVTANGAFTFATPVAHGGSYAVAVGTEPFAHSCVVSGGSGPNVSADVSTVAVACASFTESTLYSFAGGSDGVMPRGGLIQGLDGNLYGTTLDGGTAGDGTIYSITPDGIETVLHSFGVGGDGAQPLGALIQASDGNFYGTSHGGGPNGAGTVFETTPAGVETVLYSFAYPGTDVFNPTSRLLQASDGNFYGTGNNGGSNSLGAIFKVTPAGVETVLYSFGATMNDGMYPASGLIQGSDGNFYGTTSGGGVAGNGTLFNVTAAGVETVLYSFGVSGADASSPAGELIADGEGHFYGVSEGGGSDGGGTVFVVTPAGVESVIYSFGGTPSDGTSPASALLLGGDGNFYGTTLAGGTSNLGTIFVVTPAGVETVLHSFGGTSVDGASPNAGLILASDGVLYGTASAGGAGTNGTVVRFGP
jgi:uncharacterized repeat protein (TIGR03803 family)